MKKTLFLAALFATVAAPLATAATVTWDNSQTELSSTQVANGDTLVFDGSEELAVTVSGTVNPTAITMQNGADVTISGGTIGNGSLTLNGASGTNLTIGSTLTSTALTFTGGNVQINGKRTASNGNVTVNSGTVVTVGANGSLFTDANHNPSGKLVVQGTLNVQNLSYGGSLGKLAYNTGTLQMLNGGKIVVNTTSSTGMGLQIKGWGSTATLAVADGKTFTWSSSENAPTVQAVNNNDGGIASGSGSLLVLETGEGAKMVTDKDITGGIGLTKTGTGTLEYNGTIALAAGRSVNVRQGTMKVGLDNAFGTDGNIIVENGAVLDLGGHHIYNSMTLASGATIQNAMKYHGTIAVGGSLSGEDVEFYNGIGGTLKASGDVEVTLDGVSLSHEAQMEGMLASFSAAGRIYAANSLAITGCGEEEVLLSQYRAGNAALFAADGDVSISDVVDVAFSGNHTTANSGDFHHAGAISASGDVTLEASGSVVFDNNRQTGGTEAAGAVHAGGFTGASITAGSITFTNNSSESDGGAVNASMGDVNLATTEGDLAITGNRATYEEALGGAIHAGGNVTLSSSGDINISNNTATSNGGAIYAYGDIELSSDGDMVISHNEGDNGGALYSAEGNISLASANGAITVTGNVADSYGGAIKADSWGGASVTLAATNGDITFSGNEDCTGANDITFAAAGTLNLTAEDGRTLTLEGGVNGSDDPTETVEILINQNGEEGTVVLGGNSNLAFNATVSGGKLILKDGAVLGREASGEQEIDLNGWSAAPALSSGTYNGGTPAALSTGSTFTVENGEVSAETEGTAVIHADNLTVTNSSVTGLEFNVADSAQISDSTLSGTQVYASNDDVVLTVGGDTTLDNSGLTGVQVVGNGGDATLKVKDAAITGSTLTGVALTGSEESATVTLDGTTVTGGKISNVDVEALTDVTIQETSLTATVITANALTLRDSTLTKTTVNADGADANLVLDGTKVVLTDLTDTANVFVGFSTVTGTVTLDISLEALKAAAGQQININLFDAGADVGDGGTLTLQFSQTLASILTDAGADFGFGTLAVGDQDKLLTLTSGTAGLYTINLTGVAADKLVPEPATTSLGLLALAALCARRRRKA